MNVEKINNVALYAKNWYRHSNDIFADLKKYVGLDLPGGNGGGVHIVTVQQIDGLGHHFHVA